MAYRRARLRGAGPAERPPFPSLGIHPQVRRSTLVPGRSTLVPQHSM
jgi:hypothetical protein